MQANQWFHLWSIKSLSKNHLKESQGSVQDLVSAASILLFLRRHALPLPPPPRATTWPPSPSSPRDKSWRLLGEGCQLWSILGLLLTTSFNYLHGKRVSNQPSNAFLWLLFGYKSIIYPWSSGEGKFLKQWPHSLAMSWKLTPILLIVLG